LTHPAECSIFVLIGDTAIVGVSRILGTTSGRFRPAPDPDDRPEKFRPDGARNRLQIQRLKDKSGNRSTASSEVEFFRGVMAHLIGEPGHGIRAGLEMNDYRLLDFAVGSAGLMRPALAQAAHHATWRRAFKRRSSINP